MVRVHCFIDKEHITYYSPLNPSVAGTKEQVGFLVAQGCIRALCSVLDMSHPVLVINASLSLVKVRHHIICTSCRVI